MCTASPEQWSCSDSLFVCDCAAQLTTSGNHCHFRSGNISLPLPSGHYHCPSCWQELMPLPTGNNHCHSWIETRSLNLHPYGWLLASLLPSRQELASKNKHLRGLLKSRFCHLKICFLISYMLLHSEYVVLKVWQVCLSLEKGGKIHLNMVFIQVGLGAFERLFNIRPFDEDSLYCASPSLPGSSLAGCSRPA